MWIAALLVGAVLLGVGLLAVPFDLCFHMARNGALRTELRFEWLFGLVVRRLERKSSRAPRPSERKRSGRGSLLAALREADFRAQLLELARRLVRAIHVRELVARARFGLGDPAETGIAYGLASPLLVAAESMSNVELALEPDFTQEVLAGELRGDVRAVPIALLPPLARFALAPATWRAARTLRGGAR